MEKQRNQGINILRILSMLGIIGLHILNAGGAMLRGERRRQVLPCTFPIFSVSAQWMFLP